VLRNTVIEEVLGVEEKEVKGVRLRDVTTGEVTTLAISGLFLGIGHEPNAKMFAGQIDLDESGYIRTTGNVLSRTTAWPFRASLPAAMCRTAATGKPLPPPGSGCMAALEDGKVPGRAGTLQAAEKLLRRGTKCQGTTSVVP
jgi:thioredoxin reductase (NADPH)